MMRAFIRRGIAPLLALALSGCFGGGAAPTQLLTLTPAQTMATGATRSSGAGEALTVIAPSVPRAASTTRIPVYVSATSIQYLVGATWVDEPAELFRRLLGETVAARTGRLVLDPGASATAQSAVLGGQLIQFGFDPTRNEAVALYEATLSRGGGVTSQRFEARVPVATPDAAAIAPALNQAANQIAEQVSDWIGR